MTTAELAAANTTTAATVLTAIEDFVLQMEANKQARAQQIRRVTEEGDLAYAQELADELDVFRAEVRGMGRALQAARNALDVR